MQASQDRIVCNFCGKRRGIDTGGKAARVVGLSLLNRIKSIDVPIVCIYILDHLKNFFKWFIYLEGRRLNIKYTIAPNTIETAIAKTLAPSVY